LLAKSGEPQFSVVFLAGKDGFKSIRIPSVLVTKSGSIIAFARFTLAWLTGRPNQ
jgi:hypothetical protein